MKCCRYKKWLVPLLALAFAVGTPPQSFVAVASDGGGCHDLMASKAQGETPASNPRQVELGTPEFLSGCGMDHTGIQTGQLPLPYPEIVSIEGFVVADVAQVSNALSVLPDHPPPRFAASIRTHILVATFLL